MRTPLWHVLAHQRWTTEPHTLLHIVKKVFALHTNRRNGKKTVWQTQKYLLTTPEQNNFWTLSCYIVAPNSGNSCWCCYHCYFCANSRITATTRIIAIVQVDGPHLSNCLIIFGEQFWSKQLLDIPSAAHCQRWSEKSGHQKHEF